MRLTSRMRLFIGIMILSVVVVGAIGLGRVSADTSDDKATVKEAFDKEHRYKQRALSEEDIDAKIQQALEEGVIGQEKAEALKEHLAGGLIVPKGHLRHINAASMIEAKIDRALENGKLTQEQADMFRNKLQTGSRFYKKGIWRHSGEKSIGAEDKKWSERPKVSGDKPPGVKKFSGHMGSHKKKKGWHSLTREEAEKGIEKALQHGKITQEKADTILDKLKTRTGD